MRSSKWFRSAWLLVAAAALAHGEYSRPALTRGVGLDQKLNSQIPLNLVFRDEANKSVPLSTYFTTQPVILALVYYRCPNICNVTLTEIVTSMRRVAFEPGKDYQVVVVSIDPKETPDLAAAKKASYQKEFNRNGKPEYQHAGFNEGWHFLTGTQDSISKLADAVGFHYRWDERTQQFVHAGGIMIATPKGLLSRYFYGVQYAPADMRMSLVAASTTASVRQ